MADILSWPGHIAPASMSIYLLSNSKTFTSPFTGSSQTARFPGSRWCCSMMFNNLKDEEARVLEALVSRLDGQSGRVRLWDFGRSGVRNVGTPVISVDGGLGSRLFTSGWVRSRQVLRPGDYLTVGNELKKVLESVVSDARGEATVLISPMLRISPKKGQLIEVSNPYGIFRLSDNQQGRFHRRPGIFTNVTLDFVEVLS